MALSESRLDLEGRSWASFRVWELEHKSASVAVLVTMVQDLQNRNLEICKIGIPNMKTSMRNVV